MKGFGKSLSPSISKSLLIHFTPSQNVSPILLLNALVMVINERSLLANVPNKETLGDTRSNLADFLHI